MIGPDGIRRWGRYGAAGLLLRHTDAEGTVRYLLTRRGPFVHHAGTWAFPGGALRAGETPEAGALREAAEECSALPAHTVADVIPRQLGDWTYWTVVADAVERVPVGLANDEHTAGRWVTVTEAAFLPLHPGVAEALAVARPGAYEHITRNGDPGF